MASYNMATYGWIRRHITENNVIDELKKRYDADQTLLHVVCQYPEANSVKVLLEKLMKKYPKNKEDVESILSSRDADDRTFLHVAALYGTADVMKNIMGLMPRDTAAYLSKELDKMGKTARDLVEERPGEHPAIKISIRDHLDQAGSYFTEFYDLRTPPKVIIFYSTEERELLAIQEMKHVAEYFTDANIVPTVHQNLRREQILLNIQLALKDDNLSALIVFIMTHGSKGRVEAAGRVPIAINDVVVEMSREHKGKPKVLVVQACQMDRKDDPRRTGKRNDCSDCSEGGERYDCGSHCGRLDNALHSRLDARSVPCSDEPMDTDTNTSMESRIDALSPGCREVDALAPGGALDEARRKGFSLHFDDFLVLVAALDGQTALRDVMIPCLVDSMKELTACDCFTEACQATAHKMRTEIPRVVEECENGVPSSRDGKLPPNAVEQSPIYHCTLKKKLILGKEFLPSGVVSS